MNDYIITREQLRKMKHCIGFENGRVKETKNRRMEAYRNYFATSEKEEELEKLVEQGLMQVRDSILCIGKEPKIYKVTEEGYKFLSELTGVTITAMK